MDAGGGGVRHGGQTGNSGREGDTRPEKARTAAVTRRTGFLGSSASAPQAHFHSREAEAAAPAPGFFPAFFSLAPAALERTRATAAR